MRQSLFSRPSNFTSKIKNLHGFDIVLSNGHAKKIGYDKVEIRPVPFKKLLKGLDKNKYGLAIHNFSHTKEPSKKYAASDSYAKAAFGTISSEKTS